MPLSEHEERILAEIERQLAEDDPRFVARSRRRPVAAASWSPTSRLRAAIVLGVLGVLAVLGLAWSVVLAGVGMAMILGAIILGAAAVRERLQPTSPTKTPSPDDAL